MLLMKPLHRPRPHCIRVCAQDVLIRYKAYGWHTQVHLVYCDSSPPPPPPHRIHVLVRCSYQLSQTVSDVNDLGAMRKALEKARDETDKPSIIKASAGSPSLRLRGLCMYISVNVCLGGRN